MMSKNLLIVIILFISLGCGSSQYLFKNKTILFKLYDENNNIVYHEYNFEDNSSKNPKVPIFCENIQVYNYQWEYLCFDSNNAEKIYYGFNLSKKNISGKYFISNDDNLITNLEEIIENLLSKKSNKLEGNIRDCEI